MGYTSNRLRVLVANGKDFQITPREMENIAGQLDEKDAELDRLTAQLAAARVAVEALPTYYHEASCGIECGHKDCDCPAEYGETKRTEARRAVGLEG